MYKPQSNLKEAISDFISFKQSLGKIYKTGRIYLFNFDKYNYQNGNYDYLNQTLVEQWIKKKKERSNSQDMGYMSYIREFGRYLNSIDHKSYILDDNYKAVRYKAEVYLFTNDELHDFFMQIETYKRTATTIKDSLVLPAVFRFLYYFGVRCKEARVLENKDVHLELGYIDIIESKNHRDRRLFINEESRKYFEQYNILMNELVPNRKYFFSEREEIYPSCYISKYFNKMWDMAGLRKESHVQPRAYDLRHHFACENLLKWSENNENVFAKLPYLMTYMGHSNLESTYYYIHLIPDFFPKYNELSKMSNELIPEVIDNEI